MTAQQRRQADMSWFAQVRHLLLKDVRAQRWLLLTFVASLAVSTTSSLAVGRPGDLASAARRSTVPPMTPSSISFDASETSQELLVVNTAESQTSFSLEPLHGSFADLLLPVLAVLMCALIVLADHPTQPRAQWASLPYRRPAVWGAKLGFVVSLVVALTVAHAIPLVVLQLPVAEIPGRLTGTAVSMLMLCITALLLASASSDLRTVVFSALILFLAISVGGVLWLVRDAEWVVPSLLWLLLKPALVLACLGWLYFVYRKRPRATPVRLASFGLAGLMFLPDALQVRAPRDASPSAASVAPGAIVSSRLEAQRSEGGDSLTLVWHLRTSGIAPTLRAMQQQISPYAASSTRECTRMALFLGVPTYGTLQTPPLPLDSALQWPAGAPKTVDSLSFSQVVWSGLANTPHARCASKGWDVQLELFEPVIFAELPVRTGARATHRGQRVVIRDAAPNGSGLVASVVATSVGAGTLCSNDASTYVLVNRGKREAISLAPIQHDGAFGIQLCTRRFLLAPSDSAGRVVSWSTLGKQSSEETTAWLRDAQLVVIEWRSRGIVSISPSAVEDTP